ncbi:penicillin-binding protein 2 [Allonocardiopsis opalescens]|uniref:Penicillin-binding protein 2 n=1 Tax=Allonocardiopsis opalescens TaxID=1144618 RepID=A0A2T0PY75_9ACTN|nr:penicillin-binding protein 2 [Allonocardiopsis opalescens]PRX96366.1 penicillin-binding protein 2 [Allonocardiopsis opalescens]
MGTRRRRRARDPRNPRLGWETAEHTRLRFAVVQVMVLVLFASLLGRLWFLQVPATEHFQQVAAENRTRDLMVPAVRGQILDATGRPLVRNRTDLVVSVDYHALARQDDGGEAVLRALAEVLEQPYEQLRLRTRLCGPEVGQPCWQGSPYQPIPLDTDADPRRALQILERPEDFPGVIAQQQAVREYTGGERAVQALGYLSPATAEELESREGLRDQFSGLDLVGRDGVEAVYDEWLRGVSGVRTLAVDARGNVTGTVSEQPSQAGAHLVTSIDAGVQDLLEDELATAIQTARNQNLPSESAAGVVMDVRTGRLVALASLPTYDPEVWDGGITTDTYQNLLSEEAGEPLISRATQGLVPPGSTFKVSTMAAAVQAGYPLRGSYGCPGSYQVGDRSFENYEGGAHGTIDLHRALVVSCNTIFYRFGHELWLRDGGLHPEEGQAQEPVAAMAHAFGFGSVTGVDLPSEAEGRVPDRSWKREYWEMNREATCARAENGYPDVAETDPARATLLQQMAQENCVDGYLVRAGDSANFAIGQGDVLVTPLQLAVAYAAIANGGTRYEPRVGRALISADGSQVREIEPIVAGELPVDDEVLAYMRDALADVPVEGTARGAFAGFPLDEIPVAGKTGTATITGSEDGTAWFASYAPADDPQFAVVIMVDHAGGGGSAAAPVARRIYEGIYGLGDTSQGGQPPSTEQQEGQEDRAEIPTSPLLPGGRPPEELPAIRPDGSIARVGER